MAQSSASNGLLGFTPDSETRKTEPRTGLLKARVCRDVGLAAVATALEIAPGELTHELADAIKRGARYLFLMPKSHAGVV
jgi:hypothetical protein